MDPGLGAESTDDTLVFGIRPVLESLKAGQPLEQIHLQQGDADQGPLGQIFRMARQRHVPVQVVDRRALDRLAGPGARHQGVVALLADQAYAEVGDLLARAAALGQPPLVVVLDGVQDPRNLGAILRSAEALGAHGAVIPRHRAAGVTAVVRKGAAGATAHLPVARVTNTVRCLDDLKKAGLWVIGADAAGEPLEGVDLTGPVALVFGGEGPGLARLVRETCDRVVKIPLTGEVASLNVSVAAGIFLYETARQRRKST